MCRHEKGGGGEEVRGWVLRQGVGLSEEKCDPHAGNALSAL